MSDDEDKLRGTIPFEDIELLVDEEGYIDATDLLVYVGDGENVEEATDPFVPALTDSTKQHAVPVELLWKAMRPDQGWISCYAIVGRNGMLRLSADAFDKLVPGERVEIRVRRLKRNVADEDEYVPQTALAERTHRCAGGVGRYAV